MRRSLAWLDGPALVVGALLGLLTMALFAAAARDARGDDLVMVPPAETQVTTQPASTPEESTPEERYQQAWEARQAAGVETWMFVHPTWLDWYSEKYGSVLAGKLLDGYLLIMLDRDGCRAADAMRAELALCRQDCRIKVIPGLRLGPDKEYAEWTRPETWTADYEFWQSAVRDLGIEPGTPMAIDSEPYWSGSPRYPRSEDMYATAAAMGPWIEEVQSREVWVLPGHPSLWNTLYLASVATRGKHTVYLLDEGTYTRAGGDDVALEAMIRERRVVVESLGMIYVPGFYLRHAIDPSLYKTLQKCDIKRCWFFAQSTADEYNRFGTRDWMHAQ